MRLERVGKNAFARYDARRVVCTTPTINLHLTLAAAKSFWRRTGSSQLWAGSTAPCVGFWANVAPGLTENAKATTCFAGFGSVLFSLALGDGQNPNQGKHLPSTW
jgi:hypothetical protein